MNTNLITVTFKIPDERRGEISITSKKLSDSFDVDGVLPNPHVTVYQCKLPETTLIKVMKSLKKIAQDIRGVGFRSVGKNVKNNYVGVLYERTDEIMEIHRKVVEGLNFLRGDLTRSAYAKNRDLYNVAEQDHIDNYGYPYVFDEYKPHVALIKLKDKNDIKKIDDEALTTIDFISDGFEIVIIDKNGKHIEFIPFAGAQSLKRLI